MFISFLVLGREGADFRTYSALEKFCKCGKELKIMESIFAPLTLRLYCDVVNFVCQF